MRWNIFTNDYKILRQENDDASVQIKRENRISIERMISYITADNVSLFEIEVLRKDLLGLAAEAEAEGITFQDKLGVSEEVFCKSMTEDAMKKNSLEKVFNFLVRYIGAVAVYNAFMYWGFGCPKEWGMIVAIGILVTIETGCSQIIAGWIQGKVEYSKRKRAYQILYTTIYLVMYGAGLWLFFTMDPLGYGLFRWNGWVITIGLLMTALFLLLANNHYWNVQSKKYNWK